MIATVALARLIADCAPRVGPITMTAIVYYESGAREYAIGDDTDRRAYFPTRRSDAIELARQLVASGHTLDIGLAQVNSNNLTAFGIDASAAFEPCTNLQLASRILRAAYAHARRVFGAGTVALEHALSAYNSGGYWAGLGYARGVFATAAALHRSNHLRRPNDD